MHPPQRFVATPDITFSYRELGTGQPVLLLHGWPTSSFLWRDVMPHLAEQGLRPIALDLPGFGHTEPPPGARLGFSTYDRAIEAFLEALGLGATPLGLVVHDAGGPIGLHWASQHAHRVSRLAILNTLIYPELSWAVVAFVAATRAPLISGLLARPNAIRLALRFGVRSRKLPAGVLDEYAAPFHDPAKRKVLLRAGTRLSPAGFVKLSRWLESTRIPVAAIYGERDPILPDIAKTVRRLGRALPQLEVTALPHCAHFIQEEEPAEVGRLLAGFFARQ